VQSSVLNGVFGRKGSEALAALDEGLMSFNLYFASKYEAREQESFQDGRSKALKR
jgi:hypothetical protein